MKKQLIQARRVYFKNEQKPPHTPEACQRPQRVGLGLQAEGRKKRQGVAKECDAPLALGTHAQAG